MNFQKVYEDSVNPIKKYKNNISLYLKDFEKLSKEILIAEQKLFKVPLKTYNRANKDSVIAGGYNNESRTKEKRKEIIDNEECIIGDDRIEFEFGLFLYNIEEEERVHKYIINGNVGWLKIYNIALPFKYRGKGLGKKMVDAALKICKKYGKINKVVLHDLSGGFWDHIIQDYPEFEWIT